VMTLRLFDLLTTGEDVKGLKLKEVKGVRYLYLSLCRKLKNGNGQVYGEGNTDQRKIKKYFHSGQY